VLGAVVSDPQALAEPPELDSPVAPALQVAPSTAVDLVSMKQRVLGLSLQLENRERAQAMIEEALVAGNLSANERNALEARSERMMTKLDAYQQQITQLQERILTTEAGRLGSKEVQ
jgi:hypothetical protein